MLQNLAEVSDIKKKIADNNRLISELEDLNNEKGNLTYRLAEIQEQLIRSGGQPIKRTQNRESADETKWAEILEMPDVAEQIERLENQLLQEQNRLQELNHRIEAWEENTIFPEFAEDWDRLSGEKETFKRAIFDQQAKLRVYDQFALQMSAKRFATYLSPLKQAIETHLHNDTETLKEINNDLLQLTQKIAESHLADKDEKTLLEETIQKNWALVHKLKSKKPSAPIERPPLIIFKNLKVESSEVERDEIASVDHRISVPEYFPTSHEKQKELLQTFKNSLIASPQPLSESRFSKKAEAHLEAQLNRIEAWIEAYNDISTDCFKVSGSPTVVNEKIERLESFQKNLVPLDRMKWLTLLEQLEKTNQEPHVDLINSMKARVEIMLRANELIKQRKEEIDSTIEKLKYLR